MYYDHAQVLASLLTASTPSANLRTDKVVQEVLGLVKQGTNAINLRIERENSEQVTAQLVRTAEELKHSQEYYQGLLNGTAFRSHIKTDRFPHAPKTSESPKQQNTTRGMDDSLNSSQGDTKNISTSSPKRTKSNGSSIFSVEKDETKEDNDDSEDIDYDDISPDPFLEISNRSLHTTKPQKEKKEKIILILPMILLWN